ncbi:hypothetical protein Tco_1168597 [Tanacetum coccineum]
MSLYSIPRGSTRNSSMLSLKILLDHPLSYALTATADGPVVYLQQFWRTVSKVHDTENTIMLDTEKFTYIVDMVGYQGVVDKVSAFYTKNLAQPWQTMFKVFNHYAALLWWDFMNNVFQNKEAIQYPRFIKLIIDDLIKKFPNIPQKINEDYHVIKDNIPLVSDTTGNLLVRRMLIPNEFLTEEIRATDDLKEYEKVFMNVAIPMNQPQPGRKRKQTTGESSSSRKSHKITIKKKKQITTLIPPPGDDRERDEVAEATIISFTLHKTTLAAEAQENIAKVQEKLDEDETEKLIECDEDEESYVSEFVDSMINEDVDDFGTRIEPGSHKEHPENVNDDDEEIEKEETNDDVEKTDEVVKEKDNDEGASGSMKFRNKKKHTPIPTPTRSLRIDLSFDKTISKELTTTVSPTTATTSKDSSIPKRKKRFLSYKMKILLGSIAAMCRRRGQIRSHIKNKFITHEFFVSKIREVLDHCNNIVPELTFAKTNEMINKEILRLVKLAINKDREVDPINAQEMISKEFATHAPKMIKELFRKHMQNTTLNLYPTTSSLTVRKSMADLQQRLYLNMKSKPQDQAADPELWEILKAKFEKQ